MRVFNTASRSVETVETRHPGEARIYTCGPTVYAPQHVGNMRSQLFADLLRRTLAASGLNVVHVINITDVGHLTDDASEGEDKLEVAAARSGDSALDIAAKYTAQWLDDRRRLGCLEPDVLCKATDHIAEQIDMIQRLEAGGYTYRIDDGIYFDVARFPEYGRFAGLRLDEQASAGRVGNVEDKRHPADFALWKFSPAGVKRQQEWASPWGVGFPGWHIECSAMATRYLGEQFDIHTGGVDHIAVHHTNEIAQSECALGVHPWVRYWVHHEFLNLANAKMSKSEGSDLVVDNLVTQGFDPAAFRYFFLQAQYRAQQELSVEAMQAAANALDRLRERLRVALAEGGDLDAERCRPYRDEFWAAMANDLNSPQALAVVAKVARSTELSGAERWALLVDFDDALGLDLAALEHETIDPLDAELDAKVTEREDARQRRDFARADDIRDELAARGIVIEDTPAGPRWKKLRAEG